MWLATTKGFFSIVAHRDKPGIFLVRARTRIDAENVAKQFNVLIEENKRADYRFRVYINRKQLGLLMLSLAEEIDYPDFKSRIRKDKEQAKKLDIYHSIWSMFNEFQAEQAE